MIAIWGRFCGPGVVVGGSCGGYGSLLAWGWPFPGCCRVGGRVVGCVQGRELGARTSPSEVYPAGKLHLHFTCGLDFRHSL